jgi:hypothetical protein
VTEATSSPEPSPTPLFSLDLQDNGCLFAPTTLTHTYLSLMEGDQLTSKEDRQLILQALFRPASDGIVKDEGVPFSLAEVLTRTGKP